MKIPLKTPPALNPLQSRLYWLRPGFCVFSNPQKFAQPFLQPEPILQHPAAGRSTPQLPHVSPPLASCGCAFYYFSRLFYPLSILEKRNNNNSLPNLSTTHMNLVDLSYIAPYLSFFFFRVNFTSRCLIQKVIHPYCPCLISFRLYHISFKMWVQFVNKINIVKLMFSPVSGKEWKIFYIFFFFFNCCYTLKCFFHKTIYHNPNITRSSNGKFRATVFCLSLGIIFFPHVHQLEFITTKFHILFHCSATKWCEVPLHFFIVNPILTSLIDEVLQPFSVALF